MAIEKFPDPREALPEGLVHVGGDLEPRTLLRAYRSGIFPWPIEGWPLTWFCPEERAILFFDALHVPRRLARWMKQHPFRLTIDRDFTGVVRACSEVPRRDEGTWITPEMIEAYGRLHEMGHAHSVEAWEGDRLVGGLYGVEVDGLFAGESMFHRVPNASKVVLVHLVDHLRSRGLKWIDVQVISPHLETFGVRAIPRDAFLDLLARSRDPDRRLF